jgi:prepilin-type N-terminal cleavage/methylation domain-containing protein
MNERNGFTLLEVMVAMAIFAIVAAAAMSFYKFQTRESGVSSRKKIAQEAATLALMRLKKDIIAAGLGLAETDVGREDLAVFVSDGGGTVPDELYLSSVPYVDLDLAPTKPETGTTPQPYAFFTYGSAKPGEGKAWFSQNSGGAAANWSMDKKQLVVSDVRFSVDKRALGAIIIRNNGAERFKPSENDSVSITTTPKEDLTEEQKETGRHHVTFSWTNDLDSGAEVAPAVRYWLNTAVDGTGSKQHQNRGTLMRNDVAVAGAQASMSGFTADEYAPLMKVTDFQVRCCFDDGNCSPDSVNFDDVDHTPKELRYVEVTVRYIIRSGDISSGGYLTPNDVSDSKFRIAGDNTKGRCMIGGTIVLRATPRNIVLTKYLGGG